LNCRHGRKEGRGLNDDNEPAAIVLGQKQEKEVHPGLSWVNRGWWIFEGIAAVSE